MGFRVFPRGQALLQVQHFAFAHEDVLTISWEILVFGPQNGSWEGRIGLRCLASAFRVLWDDLN